MKTRWLRSLAERLRFPVEAGLEIQSGDIARWSSVLSPEAIAALHDEAVRQNIELSKLSDAYGFDVWRGDDINQFIISLSFRLYSGTREAGASGGKNVTPTTQLQ